MLIVMIEQIWPKVSTDVETSNTANLVMGKMILAIEAKAIAGVTLMRCAALCRQADTVFVLASRTQDLSFKSDYTWKYSKVNYN